MLQARRHGSRLLRRYPQILRPRLPGMCRFETSGSVVVTVYAYQSTSAVDGNAVAFPYGLSYSADKSINHTYPAVYSGKGTGYYLTFTHGTKYVSDLLSRPYIYTSNAQGGYGNSNEMIPIKMIQGWVNG